MVKTLSALSMVVVAIAAAVNYYRLAPLRELVAAVESQPYRAVEGRLSGGFAWRRMAPVTRGKDDSAPLLAAALIHQAHAEGRTSITAQHTGISRLLLRDWDGALAKFHDALSRETRHTDPLEAIAASKDASLLSDVAAAYHAHARHRNEPRSYVIAAEAAQRAWMLEKTPETAWNRALTIESLHLRQDALDAWSDYLALDDDSEWADEARQHMQVLDAPSAAAHWEKEEPRLHKAVATPDEAEILRIVWWFPNETRTRAENTYLSEFASGADRLPFCRAVGRALQRSTGESMLADTVADIDRSDARRRDEIVRGLVVYGEGRAFYTKAEFGKAAEKFRAAYETLDRAGSPFANVARMYFLSSETHIDDRQALASIDAWLAEDPIDERRYPAVAAQLRWVRGLASLRLGRPQAAIDDYERALAIFERLGERNNVALLRRNLSEAHEHVGNFSGAWLYRLSALEAVGRSGEQTAPLLEARRLFAGASLLNHMPAVAALCLNDVIAAADEPSAYDLQATARLLRARAYRDLGDAAAANADVRLARGLVPRIPDPSIREQMANDPEVIADRLSTIVDAGERQRILADAIAHATRRGFALPLAQLYSEQARQQIRAEQWNDAEVSLVAGIEQIEGERVTIHDPAHRASFLSARRELYDTLVALLCRRGAYEQAFDVVERGRARSLLELVSATRATVQTAPLRTIQASLDAYTAVVEFAPAGDHLGVWLITKTDFRFFTIDRPRSDLRRLVDRFLIAIREDDDVVGLARELDELLIKPWYREARPFERLVFVSNDDLAGLPFAALHNGGSFLVERHTVTNVPSANVLLACITRDRLRGAARESALIVAPSTSVSSIRDQAVLAASQAEAIHVSRQYRDPILLEGARATRREFIDRAPWAQVIHFAGHAIAEGTGIPGLVFAPENGQPARMHTEDIRALRFDATRVVMLAACDTAAERGSTDTDGVSSLTRAFLAAGVPAVIGSYWRVDDEATARLSSRVHALLSRGQDPAAALHAAQLDMLASGDARSRRVSAWAAFALFGGTQTERR